MQGRTNRQNLTADTSKQCGSTDFYYSAGCNTNFDLVVFIHLAWKQSGVHEIAKETYKLSLLHL